MIKVEVEELQKHLSETLRFLREEGETLKVTEHGKVIAHIVPVGKEKQAHEGSVKAFWQRIDELAAEVGEHLPEDAKVDAAEIVSEMRHELGTPINEPATIQ